MKKILAIISIILCTNIVLAQNTFTIGDITYKPTTGNEVKVRDCNSSATSVIIPETVTNNGITYNVTCIGEDAFSWCTSLVSIELPSTITTIESFAFYYCTALNSLVIPNAVTSLGWEICYNCSALTSVTIGSGISELSDGTFSYCDALQSITCLALEPPVLENSYVFPDVSTATLSVACGSLTAYSNAENLWGQLFAGRISEIIYTVNASANDTTFGEVIVTSDCESAMLTAIANPCYEFVSWNDGNTENPRYINLTSDTNLIAIFAEIVDNSSLLDMENTTLSFYPNPTKDEVNFSTTIDAVEVIDLSGKVVMKAENTNRINISALPAGAYYLKLHSNGKTITQKAIKE